MSQATATIAHSDHASPFRLSLVQLLSLTAVLLLAFAASLGMAFNIDAIIVSFGTSNSAAGFVASTEMAAIAVGTLIFARLASRLNPHRVFWCGVLTIVLFNGLSIIAPSVLTLALTRVPAGFALGAVVATIMATVGRAQKPEMNFGVINSMVGVMGLVIAFVLPRALNLGNVIPFLEGLSPLDGLYLVYIALSACALLFIRTTPTPEPIAAQVSSQEILSKPPRSGWIALVGLGCLFFGHAILGLFLVKIGRGLGLSPETIGYVFMAGGLFGIAAPMIAGYVGSRVASVPPVTIIIALLLVAAYFLVTVTTPLGFMLTAPLYAGLPMAMMPILLGAISRLDASGALVGSHGAFIMTGSALAPIIGGSLSDSGGFTLNGPVASLCFAGGLLLALPALRMADRLRT